MAIQGISRAPFPRADPRAADRARDQRREAGRMANYLYRGDLPAGLDLGPAVAVDSETMGLVPGRDRLCLVQLSAGDGDAHLVQILPGVAAPEPRGAARRPGAAEALPLRPVRHRRAARPPRRADRAGLLHQDRLAAGADLHRPARAQGPGARAPRHRHLQAAAVERLGRRRRSARRSSTMRPPTCSTCTGCGPRSTPAWRARAGPSWRRPASTSCRSRAAARPRRLGRTSTSSRTAEGAGDFNEDEFPRNQSLTRNCARATREGALTCPPPALPTRPGHRQRPPGDRASRPTASPASPPRSGRASPRRWRGCSPPAAG